MLAPQLCPLGKLVLTARPIEIVPDRQVFLLLLALVGKLFRERGWKREVEAPYLCCKLGSVCSSDSSDRATWRGDANQVVDSRCAYCVD